MGPSEDRSEIAFFDVETNFPTRYGQGYIILEFGSILVCPRTLVELDSYSTLIRPADHSLISSLPVRSNGITRYAVVSAPTFLEIADRVYDILHGRIWAGHNIIRFDCARIREAFADIGRPAPEPTGTIDSWVLLTHKFGRRAGDMKMATLATYFGLGRQTHRCLDDVRMNFEVLKCCATVLFMESSLSDTFTTNSSWVSPKAITKSPSNHEKSSSPNLNSENGIASSSTNQISVENHPLTSLMTNIRDGEAIDMMIESSTTSRPDPFNIAPLNRHEIIADQCHQPDVSMDEKSISELSESEMPSSTVFLEPDEVFIPSISASFYRGSQRIKLLHKDIALQLCCRLLKVGFEIIARFTDNADRPRLNFVVDAPPSLCRVLDSCDGIAHKLYLDSGSNSDWRPVLTLKDGYFNYPTVRLHIPSAVCGQIAIYATEIYQKESSGSVERLVFSKFDASELMSLFTKGTFVDAFFSLESYDYQQSAGIRLAAKKLIIHS